MKETYLRMPGGGGLGDLICFVGAAGIYAKLHPSERVFANVLPEILKCYHPPRLHYHPCEHVPALKVYDEHRTKHESPLRNYAGTFLSAMGVAIDEPPEMELPRLAPAPRLAPGSYIVLQPRSGAAQNPDRWEQFVQAMIDVCRACVPGFPIVCAGHPNTTRAVSGVDYDYLSNPLSMLRLIQYAALVLTPRSASAHIAAAYHVPAFLWLPHDGENWHLDYPNWTTCRVGIDADSESVKASLRSFLRSPEILSRLGN